MNKNVGLTYVKDFSFPAEQGFTGSASSGVHQVKGYQRGGVVKKAAGGYYGKPGDKYPALKSGPAGARKAMPKNVKKHGGPVKKQMGGFVGNLGGMGQEREITVDDVTISVPKSHGGKMSMHDKLKHEGGKMGYAYGGQVKPSNTSSQFKETRGKQKTMDTGVQPARRGRNQAEIEAGGTKRMLPGLHKGGGVHKVRAPKTKRMADYAGVTIHGKTSDAEARKLIKASKKGMPKNVKSHGGLMRYAAGGVVKKAGAAL